MHSQAAQRSHRPTPAVAVALPFPGVAGAPVFAAVKERLEAVRDTLVVLALQISFRVVMWLRHLNY